jgi:perosamine synthetase
MAKTITDLAIRGGRPVRDRLLSYGRQWIDDDDVAAVVAVLRSDMLTTGPRVAEFERAFAAAVGAREAVAVSNGTAALHAAVFALGLGPGHEVIVPPMTFAATANCVAFQGATPVFVDVAPDTLLIDPARVAEKITPRTRAIIAVDYTGQPCDYDGLAEIARPRRLALVADACHALGASDRGRPAGVLADLNVFSFHPVKHITTGEGGMVTTSDPQLAERMRRFRNHGITHDHRQREERQSWFYEIIELGYNYRLTDIQCALGLSQLHKLSGWIARRRHIAGRYNEAFADLPAVRPLSVRPGVGHAYHLYVVQLDPDRLTAGRDQVFAALRAEGIGVNVHYIPTHLHPYYRHHHGTGPGLCPVAEQAYERILSLPLFPRMTDADVDDVIAAVTKVTTAYSRSVP